MDIENSNFRPINKIEYCFKNRQEQIFIYLSLMEQYISLIQNGLELINLL